MELSLRRQVSRVFMYGLMLVVFVGSHFAIIVAAASGDPCDAANPCPAEHCCMDVNDDDCDPALQTGCPAICIEDINPEAQVDYDDGYICFISFCGGVSNQQCPFYPANVCDSDYRFDACVPQNSSSSECPGNCEGNPEYCFPGVSLQINDDPLPVPENGFFEDNVTGLGFINTIHCNEGFQFESTNITSQRIICQFNSEDVQTYGYWKSVDFEDIVTGNCEAIPDFCTTDNALIAPQIGSITMEYQATCLEGEVLQGIGTSSILVSCDTDGQISSPPPCIPYLITEASLDAAHGVIIASAGFYTNGDSLFNVLSFENCQKLFDNVSMALLGTQPQCIFTSSTVLHIQLGDQHMVANDTNLTFRSDSDLQRAIVAGENSTVDTLVGPETFVVTLDALIESPAIFGPTRVNPCDGTYTVELFATYESLYGRDGIYDWTATPADRCLFVSESGNTATLSLENLPRGQSCEVALTITNFVGVVSNPGFFSVLRADQNAPVVTFESSEQSPWTRDKGYRLAVVTGEIDCLSADSVDGALIRYSWSLVNADDDDSVVPLNSTDQSSVFIESYNLEVGNTYRFDVELSYDSAVPLFSPYTESFVVEIEDAPLTAVVRRIQGLDQLDVLDDVFEQATSAPLRLSGANSYDGNVGPDDGNAEGLLLYIWSCRTVPYVGDLVDFNQSDYQWGDCDVLSNISTDQVDFYVPGETLADSSAYHVTLTVQAAGLEGPRIDTQDVYFVASARRGPVVSINLIAPLTGNDILETDTLRLQGVVDSDRSVTWQGWTELNYDILSSSDATGYLNTPLDGTSLSLDPGLLRLDQETYRFQLAVVDDEDARGSAIVTINVVRGPEISNFSISPLRDPQDDQGPPLVETDQFRLSVVVNVDQREDLEYQFSYKFQDDNSDDPALVVTQFQSQSFADVNLPAGILVLVATVASESGFSSRKELPVVIEDAPDACETFQKSRDRLETEIDFSDSDNAFHSAYILAQSLLDDDIRECADVDVDEAREFLYASADAIWNSQVFHSITESAQLVQCISALSDDTERFTLSQISESLSWINVTFDAIDRALSQNLQSTGIEVAASISFILSNSLSARSVQELEGDDDDELDLFCDVVRELRSQLNKLLRSQVAELLVGEEGADIISDTIVAQAIQASVGQGETIDVDGADLEIVVESDGSDHSVGVSFASYDGVIGECFATREGSELASSIVDIDILQCSSTTQDVSTENGEECVFRLGNALFRLETTSALSEDRCVDNTRTSEEFQCSFWHEEEMDWRTDGCETVHSEENPTQVQCNCTHLTTFSVIKNIRSFEDPDCFVLSNGLVYLSATMYCLLAALGLHQISRLMMLKELIPRSILKPLATHVCIVFAAVSRFGFVVALVWYRDNYVLQATAAISLSLQFGVFALVFQQWAAIYHGMFQRENKDRNILILKIVFSSASVIIAIAFVTTLGILATLSPDSDAFDTTARVGTLLMSAVSLVTAAIFAIYGTLLFRVVMDSYRNNLKTTTKSESTKKSAWRIMLFMILFVTSFLIESCINLVSIAEEELFTGNFSRFQSAYIAFNVLTYALVLQLSNNMVVNVKESYMSTRPVSKVVGEPSHSYDLIEHHRLSSRNNSQSNISAVSRPRAASSNSSPPSPNSVHRSLNAQRVNHNNVAYFERSCTDSQSAVATSCDFGDDIAVVVASNSSRPLRKEHARAHSLANISSPNGPPRSSPRMNGHRVPSSQNKRFRSQSLHELPSPRHI